MHARWRSADHHYYLYDLPREVAASERMFKIPARYGAALSQVAWDRLPNRQLVNTAYLLIRLSTEGARPSLKRGRKRAARDRANRGSLIPLMRGSNPGRPACTRERPLQAVDTRGAEFKGVTSRCVWRIFVNVSSVTITRSSSP